MKKTANTDSPLAVNLRRVRKPVKTQINTGSRRQDTQRCGYSCVFISA